MRSLGLGSLLIVALFFRHAFAAEEPPLITDRPDRTESAFTVPRGLFQIEGGWGYGEGADGASDVTFQSFPQALLRIGVTDGFEVRLGVPGLDIVETDSQTGQTREHGLVDATLGFKAIVVEQRGAVPQTAFIGTLVIPSGDDEFSSERVDPAFRFAFSNKLGERVSLGYNVGMLWLSERDAQGLTDTRSLFDWTVSAGFSMTERIGVFVEAFGTTGASASDPSSNGLDAGMTYLLTPRLQLDASASAGFSDAAPDWTFGVGASYRFPRYKG